MSQVGLLWDEVFLRHVPPYYHPESPARLEAIISLLKSSKLWERLKHFPPRKATQAELSKAHKKEFVTKTIDILSQKESGYLDMDTYFSAGSLEAALYGIGGLIDMARDIWQDKLKAGFALIRPPGHHATSSRSMGFCIFNNIAIVASVLIEEGCNSVFILDWDLHHGNGTQEIFYDQSRVFFCSLHQYPHYPGTGSLSEIGEGEGKGYTVNIPFAPGAGDAEYITAFKRVVIPLISAFKPEVILVSAGFDAYRGDPLGDLCLTPLGFSFLTRMLQQFRSGICFVLEGGYNLRGLAECVKSCISTLCQPQEIKPPSLLCSPQSMEVLDQIIQRLSCFWNLNNHS